LLTFARHSRPIQAGGSKQIGESGSFEANGFDQMRKSFSQILIVDDAPDFCESLAWQLKDEGYKCRVAGNGQQAIDLLEQEKAHLILLDWEMPIMNGAGFLKRRGLCWDLLNIPVLVLSAGINIERNATALKASFLQKPLDYLRLLSKMKALLAETPA
jgi:DNA-binding response OmpR family regulator